MNDDKKWCPACNRYVPYLTSPKFSYCRECLTRVRLFEAPPSGAICEVRRSKGAR